MQNVLRALAFRYDDALVVVDQTCYNPARISKIYGTPVCKGDTMPERPRRLARILEAPAELTPVPQELLAAVAARQPPPPPRPSGHDRSTEHLEALDVAAWLAEHNLAVSEPKAWQGGQRWVFETCPWNPAHTDRSAYVVQFANDAIAAGCHHNGCQGQGWRDLRELVEGPRLARRESRGVACSSPALTSLKQAEAALGVEVRDAYEGEPDWSELACVALPDNQADTVQVAADLIEEVLMAMDGAADREVVEDLLPLLTQRCVHLDRNAMLRVDRRLRKGGISQRQITDWHVALNEQRRAARQPAAGSGGRSRRRRAPAAGACQDAGGLCTMGASRAEPTHWRRAACEGDRRPHPVRVLAGMR